MKTSLAVRWEPAGVAHLVERYLQIRARVGSGSVEGAIRLGECLEQAAACLRKKKLSYLLFLELVGEQDTTAARHRHLYRLNQEEPALVRDWSTLGKSKLYWIARLTRENRRRVLSPFSRAHLHRMSERDFAARAKKLLRPRSRTALSDASSLCRRAEATRRALGRLRRPPPGPVRKRLAATLRKLAAAAQRALAAVERAGVRQRPASRGPSSGAPRRR